MLRFREGNYFEERASGDVSVFTKFFLQSLDSLKTVSFYSFFYKAQFSTFYVFKELHKFLKNPCEHHFTNSKKYFIDMEYRNS